MKKTEDIFETRLRRLASGQDGQTADNIRHRAVQSLSMRQLNERQNSVLLPTVAICSLLLGGAAFATMMAMPNPEGDAFAQTYFERQP
jgi:hypothetical protein